MQRSIAEDSNRQKANRLEGQWNPRFIKKEQITK